MQNQEDQIALHSEPVVDVSRLVPVTLQTDKVILKNFDFLFLLFYFIISYNPLFKLFFYIIIYRYSFLRLFSNFQEKVKMN